MADAGNALSLADRGGGEKGSRGAEEKAVPASRAQAVQQPAAEDGSAAAAAGTTRVYVLPLPVIEKKAAVVVIGRDVRTVPEKEIQNNAPSDQAQVPGNDEVIVFRLPVQVPEMALMV